MNNYKQLIIKDKNKSYIIKNKVYFSGDKGNFKSFEIKHQNIHLYKLLIYIY